MSDTYEATFTWPAGPNEVIITGTFDNWSKSTKLVRSWEGSFSGTLKFPWGTRILFKYVVDGQWVTSRHEKTETDHEGNVNNVFQAPPPPEPTPTAIAPATNTTAETQTAPAPAPSEPKPQPVTDPSVKETIVETLTSVKDSALATEGVHPPNVTSYVASAVGAAVATVTGVDPINAPKIPVDEPKANAAAETELDLLPVGRHGKLPAPPNDIGKLPSLLPAASDGKEAVSPRPVEGLPSLLPVASELGVVSASTVTETAPPKPAAAIPEPTPTVSTPPVTTKTAPAPEPSPAAKVPEPTKAVEETTHDPETSEGASTLKEKGTYGADEYGRNANSTPGSTLKKKKRGTILRKLTGVFRSDKSKEKPKI